MNVRNKLAVNTLSFANSSPHHSLPGIRCIPSHLSPAPPRYFPPRPPASVVPLQHRGLGWGRGWGTRHTAKCSEDGLSEERRELPARSETGSVETLGGGHPAASSMSEGPCRRPPSSGSQRPAATALQGPSWLWGGGFSDRGRTAAGRGAELGRWVIPPAPRGKVHVPSWRSFGWRGRFSTTDLGSKRRVTGWGQSGSAARGEARLKRGAGSVFAESGSLV